MRPQQEKEKGKKVQLRQRGDSKSKTTIYTQYNNIHTIYTQCRTIYTQYAHNIEKKCRAG